MHANAIALSALLLGAGLLGASSAQAVMTPDQGSIVGPAPASSEPPAAALIQLAEGHKGGDKYMSGKAGGRHGVGGTAGGKKGGK